MSASPTKVMTVNQHSTVTHFPPPVVRNFAGWLAATLMPRFRMEEAAPGTCLERQDGDGMGYPEYL